MIYRHLNEVAIAICIVIYVAFVVCSEPEVGFDAGNGVLDLLNFSDGGSFAHHAVPDLSTATGCTERRTTWWSPGQWFFFYPFYALGLSLGRSINAVVLLSIILGVIGWAKCWSCWGWSRSVVLSSVLLVLCSRYCYVNLSIYSGAAILEFAAAPWLILLWRRAAMLGHGVVLCCLPMFMLGSYFVKSSLLILCGILTLWSLYQEWKWERRWWLILLSMSLLLIGKWLCDEIYVGNGNTPFSSGGSLILNKAIGLGHGAKFAFILALPFVASLGLDDYVNYVFKHPSSAIFEGDSSFYLLLYGLISVLVVAGVWHLLTGERQKRLEWREIAVLTIVCYVGFSFLVFVLGKPISVGTESRHCRVMGLILLPFVVDTMKSLSRRIVTVAIVVLGIYGCGSLMSKMNRGNVVIEQYGLRLSNMENAEAWEWFVKAAERTDYFYVINADWKFPLNKCKGFFSHDDFRSVETIRGRKDVDLDGQSICFLLPLRFMDNGKWNALRGNFEGVNGFRDIEVVELGDHVGMICN